MFKLSNFIIVHNKSNVAELVNEYHIRREKVKIIPHGNYSIFLNTELGKKEAREKIGICLDKKIILFFGNIRPGKGLETAISAFKMLKDCTDSMFLIVGKVSKNYDIGWLRKELENEFLKSRIVFRNNFISDEFIESYYKASDIILVPYENAFESGVLRYAFSCGVPVIASDIDIFKEFAVDMENCLIFKRGDARDLSEKIRVLLTDRLLAEKISMNARELSNQKWDWMESAYKTKEVYELLRVEKYEDR